MTARIMAEVLAEHYIDLTRSSPDNHGYCICGGWVDGMDESWDEHQAENLSAAGFGLVADAGAKALREAARELMEVTEHDSRMPGIRFAVGFLAGQRKQLKPDAPRAAAVRGVK